MERDSFIFYRSFYEAIKELPRDIQGEVLTAIMEYGLNGVTTDVLKPMAKAIITLIKPQIDANYKRFENGKKGGRPPKNKTKTEAGKNQSKTKPEPNVNVNANEDIETPSPSSFDVGSLFSVDVLSAELLDNQQILDAMIKNKANKFEDINHLKNRLDLFLNDLKAKGTLTKEGKDFCGHFRNWHLRNYVTPYKSKEKIRYV